jgi:hypothetical protein
VGIFAGDDIPGRRRLRHGFAVRFVAEEIILGFALRNLHRFGQGRGERHARILAASAIVASIVVVSVRRLSGTLRTIADRYAVVIGVDFAECQEPVPVSAIIDKSSLQRGFDARYLCEIYISFYLTFR